jgi:hypothetical protein
MLELLFDGIDFFSHAAVFGFAAYFSCRLFRNRPFLIGAIVIFCFLNVVGIGYEMYQGVVRDWTYDLVANNVGILGGLVYYNKKFPDSNKRILSKEDKAYVKSSLERRLRIKKRN